MTTPPKDSFNYTDRDRATRPSASKILTRIFEDFGPQRSVIDIGCGVGTWLAVAKSLGATNTRGIEGEWIEKVDCLQIPSDLIELRNLENNWEINGFFDLGISLEVAEHLSPVAGERLVKNLVTHCQIVLFSAATPGQGGIGHINEQWPEHWQNLFLQHDFEAIDCIRTAFWNDDSVLSWYRQNAIIYATKNVANRYYMMLADPKTRKHAPLARLQTPHSSFDKILGRRLPKEKKSMLERAKRLILKN